jgi:hypothetical protein
LTGESNLNGLLDCKNSKPYGATVRVTIRLSRRAYGAPLGSNVWRQRGIGVPNFKTIELKPFVPAKDYELSKRFYLDIGFTLASDTDGVAYFHHENVSFLLQRFYAKEFAENYSINISAVEQQPWRMRDFVLVDPSGVLWRIAQNTA